MRFNENLYAAIEDAVKNNTFLNMEQIKQHKHLLRTWGNESDLTFTIDGVYWMDKARNVYIPLLSVCSANGFSGLKVTGKVTLDNWSYGKVGIFRKENRYTSVFRKMEERKMNKDKNYWTDIAIIIELQNQIIELNRIAEVDNSGLITQFSDKISKMYDSLIAQGYTKAQIDSDVAHS